MKQILLLTTAFTLTVCIGHFKDHQTYELEVDLTYYLDYENYISGGGVVFTMDFVKSGALPVRHFGYAYSQSPDF